MGSGHFIVVCSVPRLLNRRELSCYKPSCFLCVNSFILFSARNLWTWLFTSEKQEVCDSTRSASVSLLFKGQGPVSRKALLFFGSKGKFWNQNLLNSSTIPSSQTGQFCFVNWYFYCIIFKIIETYGQLDCKHGKHKELFGSEKVIGSFEKRAPGHWESKQHNLVSLYTTFEKLLIKIKWLIAKKEKIKNEKYRYKL